MKTQSRVLSLVLLSSGLIATSADRGMASITAGGDTCATATVIASLPYNDPSGDTTGATNQILALSTACAGGGMVTRPGPDLVYSFTVFSGNSLTFSLTQVASTYDPTIYILGTCTDGSSCVVESDTGIEGQSETIGPRTFNPGTYYLYVDSIYAPEEGPDHGTYTLSVTGTLGVPNNTSFYTLTPCRVLDTRNPAGPLGGPALSAGVPRSFTITGGACGVPATAKTISINATVTQPTGPGHLVLFPGGTVAPLASTINFGTGQTRANNAIVSLGTDGTISVLSGQPAGNTVHFILDVNGYFQ